MLSIGMVLVKKYIASYIQENYGKAVLAVYIATKNVLPTLHYYQDGVLLF